MDALVGLLDGPRARNAFLLRTVLDPPWSIRIQDEAPLTVVSLVRGHAWIVHDDDPPLLLTAGDVAVILGPEPYTVADHPDTAPQAVIHPGQRCETPDGRSLAASMGLGVRTWGTNLDGRMMMLTGAYPMRGEISRRLLDALPKLLVLREDEWDCPVVPLLTAEIVKDEPGQEVVLDRLLDLLLIAVLRAWFARADAPAWYSAFADPVVGQAVRLLQQNPAHPWTVASLAAKIGVSRAALARRFTDLVGEPPMAFLTGWRLALAADLLRETDATVGAVARQVGYGSSFALSTAFKRERGVSPQEFRAT
ncbi:AraC family transcriptional regulator [Umezawaea endophytica]|uniref:AraC family transcriptional regulator n=1 Tax=Umezawaea endophytica TaxID=1654476 RepID=A0A9X2VL53_9PSEU|nr:AraC family transcriptional regulator [Umezawaea endophytica]MCS7477188.1 AraC family transcriptional regulator [Umezawaea endophytica]